MSGLQDWILATWLWSQQCPFCSFLGEGWHPQPAGGTQIAQPIGEAAVKALVFPTAVGSAIYLTVVEREQI